MPQGVDFSPLVPYISKTRKDTLSHFFKGFIIMGLTKSNLKFVEIARGELGNEMTIISTQEIQMVVDKHDLTWPWWLTRSDEYRVARGTFVFPFVDGTLPNTGGVTTSVKPVAQNPVQPSVIPPVVSENVSGVETPATSFTLQKGSGGENKIPSVRPTYVPFGNFKDVHSIVKAGVFYPTFITGLSGNGKTEMVEQVCAKLQREFFRVNFTVETDEDDLIGGFRLINGETIWFDGPVVEAMRRGSILLLDEVDLASNKIMCLQSIMEGNGIYIKKINEFVEPEDGFNIFATANTKGKGDESGMFMFTGILNEAFLERFPITLEQDYPIAAIEKRILKKIAELNGEITDEVTSFIDCLVSWGNAIRKTFKEDSIDEIITTRRLVHIIRAFGIFGDKMDSIEKCIARFDDETKNAFLDMYMKIDETVSRKVEENEENKTEDEGEEKDDTDCPF
jgi:hypothetical protein